MSLQGRTEGGTALDATARLERRPDGTRVVLEGALGVAQGDAVRQVLIQALACEGSVTLDLVGLESGDTALWQLVAALTIDLRRVGRSFVVLGPPATARAQAEWFQLPLPAPGS